MAKKVCKNCGEELAKSSEFCPKCGNKTKKRNMFLFAVAMFILFILVMEIFFPISAGLFQVGMFGKYGESALMELLMLAFMVIVLLLSGNGYVFTDNKKGFFKSLALALPMFLFTLLFFGLSVINLFTEKFNAFNFIGLIFLCALVGLAEEFLCRAWLQNEFIERFSQKKKGIILSIVVASIVFGLMHITNLFTTPQGAVDTMLQILQAVASGFMFGCIYYRTKNIWSVAFIHGFFDFSLMLTEVNLIKDCVSGEQSTAAIIIGVIASLILMTYYVFAGIFALTSDEEPKFFKNPKKVRMISIIAMAIAFFGFMAVSVLDGTQNSSICYEFKEKEVEQEYYIAQTNRTKFVFGGYGYDYTLEKEDDKLMLSIDDKSIELKFDETLYDYLVIDNEEYVDLIVHCYQGESIIYHEKLEKFTFKATDKYLEKIKDGFEKVDVPDLKGLGYLLFDNKETKYPYFQSYGGEILFIDDDGELYIIKK